MWSPIVVTSHPTLCAGAQAVTDMLAISLLGLMLRFVETLMFVPAVGEVLMILRYMIVDSWPVMVILFYFTFVCAVLFQTSLPMSDKYQHFNGPMWSHALWAALGEFRSPCVCARAILMQ